MASNRATVEFEGKLVPIKPINDSFTLAKCYVMALGRNKRRLEFSKEVVEDALPTLFNIPVVGHLYQDPDGNLHMGGHDKALVKNDKGRYKFKKLTVPFGVVPQQDNVTFEDVKEKDGTTKTYLTADVILWTARYPELLDAAYDDEILFNESMEIDYFDFEKTKDQYLKVKKFQFTALCLLGKSDDADFNVNPCFPSSVIEAYEFSEKDGWEQLAKDFKDELAKVFSEFSETKFDKGGESMLTSERIAEILKEYGIAQDKLSFDFSEMSEEDFTAKLKEEFEIPSNEPAGEPVAEPKPEFVGDVTYNQRNEMLWATANKLGKCEQYITETFYVNDFNDKYVYMYHVKHDSNGEIKEHIRCAYSVDGEKASIDITTAVPIRLTWVTKEDEEAMAARNAEFAELEKYKADREEADRRKEYGDIIAQFSDLTEIEEYKTVVGNAMEFSSAEELEKELYALRGKYGTSASKKKINVDSVRIPVSFSDKEDNSLAAKERRFVERYASKA